MVIKRNHRYSFICQKHFSINSNNKSTAITTTVVFINTVYKTTKQSRVIYTLDLTSVAYHLYSKKLK